jgi:hypothetical protein
VSKSKKSGGKTVIEGIQADSVTADVMAVGRGAKATKVVIGSSEETKALADAVEALRAGLDTLDLDAEQRGVVDEDVEALEGAVKQEQLDVDKVGGALRNLQSKLKMVGVVL